MVDKEKKRNKKINYQCNDPLKHVFPFNFSHSFVNIIKAKGKNGNILVIGKYICNHSELVV